MAKKIIQVPVDAELLTALDQISRKKHQARSELIRLACQYYLEHLETAELEAVYQAGYEKIPEGSEFGESQLVLTAEVLPAES